MDITQIADLAKQAGRLDDARQWVLADALASLNASAISQVAAASGRNESTLLQYARAAQRWHPADRVGGVSFSAHRVALSWHDPRALLLELKQQHGSPTVKQVRRAMGLEVHPAVEYGVKMLKAIDDKASTSALTEIYVQLEKALISRNWPTETETEPLPESETETVPVQEDIQEEEPEATTPTWKPLISTADVAGL